MEIGIDGHVVAETLGRAEQCVELDLFHRSVAALAALALTDRVQDLVIVERIERRRDRRLLLHEGQIGQIVHDLQIVPELRDGAVDRRAAIRQ